MPVPGLVRLEDQRGAVAVLGKVPVEAIDRQVELAVRVPSDVEIVLVERPVAGLGREFVPGQPPRLVEPEAVGIGVREVVELGELARADPGVEIRQERDGRLRSQTLAHVDHEAVADVVPEQPLIGLVDLAHLDELDLRVDVLRRAEIEHLLRFGNAADRRSADRAVPPDEVERR